MLGGELGSVGPVVELRGGAVGQPEQASHTGSVAGRHGVVQQRVDGGAQVEQHEGDQVEVLGHGVKIGAGVRRHGEEGPAHVEGQPA